MKRLLSHLLGRPRAATEAPQPPMASAPEGMRLIAIGDVHGRLDLLQGLVHRLEAEVKAGPTLDTRLILLGDYIDRGPQSADVLDWLCDHQPDWARVHLLRGNHEQALLDILDGTADDETISAWLLYGGRDTLASYRLGAPVVYADDPAYIAEAVRKGVPSRHHRLLGDMVLSLRFGDYLFVHAGVRPGVPIDAQSRQDLIWIREPFLSSTEDFGAVVVHGHSITRTVSERPNRIGIDTGAYSSGRLTALVAEATQRRYVTTGTPDDPRAGL
ncbi:metallophosphoesterase family protein [Parapedomonas caeni]